jgi:DNA-binding transcriptional regulator YiaG
MSYFNSFDPFLEIKLEDLLAKTITTETGCMEWQGARRPDNYGMLSRHSKEMRVHRLSCFLAHGETTIPRAVVMHLCDNRPCINPEHLRWGTQKENIQDASAKGLMKGRNHTRGEDHPMSKLTWLQVNQIRRMRRHNKIPQRVVAKLFYISQATVNDIDQEKIWIP